MSKWARIDRFNTSYGAAEKELWESSDTEMDGLEVIDTHQYNYIPSLFHFTEAVSGMKL